MTACREILISTLVNGQCMEKSISWRAWHTMTVPWVLGPTAVPKMTSLNQIKIIFQIKSLFHSGHRIRWPYPRKITSLMTCWRLSTVRMDWANWELACGLACSYKCMHETVYTAMCHGPRLHAVCAVFQTQIKHFMLNSIIPLLQGK